MKTSKLHVTGFCEGNSPVTDELICTLLFRPFTYFFLRRRIRSVVCIDIYIYISCIKQICRPLQGLQVPNISRNNKLYKINIQGMNFRQLFRNKLIANMLESENELHAIIYSTDLFC